MKISFSKYAPVELLIQKQGVGRIISFVAIVFLPACVEVISSQISCGY